jgi:hypothetical protein
MNSLEDGKVLCQECFGGTLSRARASALMQNKMPILCLDCGEVAAKKVKHTIAPMHKSNYVVITNRTDLVGLNNKGGLVK